MPVLLESLVHYVAMVMIVPVMTSSVNTMELASSAEPRLVNFNQSADVLITTMKEGCVSLTNVSPNTARMVAKDLGKMADVSACVMSLSLVPDVRTSLMVSLTILVETLVHVRMEANATLAAIADALMTTLVPCATLSLEQTVILAQVFSVIMVEFVLWTLSAWSPLVSVIASTPVSDVRISTLVIVYMEAL